MISLVGFLQKYVDQKLASFYVWRQPRSSVHAKEAGYFLKRIAINHCIMRARHISEWVVVIDNDELLVPNGPRYNFSAVNMLQDLASNVSHAHVRRVEMRSPLSNPEGRSNIAR
jgi:hypothetical protein